MKKSNRPVSIAIDALGIDKPGGARTATLYLFEQVIAKRPQWKFTFYLSKYEESLKADNVKQVILPLRKGIAARFFFQIYLLLDLLLRKVDLIHFSKSQASIVFGPKTVFTIFDMTTVRYPQQFSRLAVWYWQHIQRYIAQKTDVIVTISNDAACDITSIYKLNREKIRTIYLASQFEGLVDLSEPSISHINRELNLPVQYSLYIGLLAKKKNLETLINAIALMKMKGMVVEPLLMVGPKYSADEAADLLQMINQSGLSSLIRYLGEVDRASLRIILRQARCLVLPSMHEGFGITAIEAIKTGVPVIASNTSAMPEIIGEGGLLVNDYLSADAWAQAISKVQTDETLRAQMIKAGLRQAANYSWQQSAQKLVSLYAELLGIQ